jgi:DNA mismatch repair protein MutS
VPPDIFPQIEEINTFLCAQEDKDVKAVLQKLDSATFAGEPSAFSHHGRTIWAFVKLEEVKEKFSKVMEVVGQIDFYMAAAKLVKNSAGKKNGFCFPEFVNNFTPVFDSTGMWDVFIDPENAVPNDLILGKGTYGATCGALVSGPNYGGKSVFLRGMMTSALLAQSLGIAPAKSMQITPFHSFDTYVAVQDDPEAKESLFSAEMARVESMLDAVATADRDGKKVFIIGDELLTGTKPKYAEALVRSILQKLAKAKNGIFIIATHFDEVIQNAPVETNGAFKQLKVGSIVDPEGFYAAPTFKVESGVSSVDSALFVAGRKLENHPDIIERAKQILKSEQHKQSL